MVINKNFICFEEIVRVIFCPFFWGGIYRCRPFGQKLKMLVATSLSVKNDKQLFSIEFNKNDDIAIRKKQQ